MYCRLFFASDLLDKKSHFAGLLLKVVTLLLDGSGAVSYQRSFLFVLKLLNLPKLDFKPNPTARSLQLHEMLAQLRVFIIFH